MLRFDARKLGALSGLFLTAALALAACGSAGASGGGYGGYGGSTGTTGASGGVNLQCGSGATVCTKTVIASGKSVTALADSAGMTLYYFTPDNATTATCTGACAANWPPLKAGASVTGAGLSAPLTTVNGANGAQVEYNGHPLYRFGGDKSPSDAKGNDLLDKWYVATVSLAAAPAGASPTSAPGYSGAYPRP